MKTSINSNLGCAMALTGMLTWVLQCAAGPSTQANALNAAVHDVREFGATGDGVTFDTPAIQRAIDSLSKEGGGRLVFPPPGRYLTGTIFLKDNVTLDVQAGATILGSQQQCDYSKDVGRFPYLTEAQNRVLIDASKVRNVGLTGRGTINGNGAPPTLLNPPPGEAAQRAMLVRFDDCTQIRVEQLTATESFGWAFHFARCKDVRIDGLSIPNRRQDGIDLESCEDVTVANCNIKAGDDAIVILSNRNIPCRNVTIDNCILLSKWAGIRLGPLSYGDINNITVANCIIRDGEGGGIKIAMLEGGEIRNGLFSNIVMDNVVCPILVMLVGNYEQTDNPQHPRMPLGKISHLSFSHITGTATGGLVKEPDAQSVIFLHGHPQRDLEAIALSDIDLVMAGGGTAQTAADRGMLDADASQIIESGTWPEHRPWGVSPAGALHARHIKGLSLDRVRFGMARPDLRSAVFIQQSSDINLSRISTDNQASKPAPRVTLVDCQDALIAGCLDHRGGNAFVALEGANTRGVSLQGNSLASFSNTVRRSSETPANAAVAK